MKIDTPKEFRDKLTELVEAVTEKEWFQGFISTFVDEEHSSHIWVKPNEDQFMNRAVLILGAEFHLDKIKNFTRPQTDESASVKALVEKILDGTDKKEIH